MIFALIKILAFNRQGAVDHCHSLPSEDSDSLVAISGKDAFWTYLQKLFHPLALLQSPATWIPVLALYLVCPQPYPRRYIIEPSFWTMTLPRFQAWPTGLHAAYSSTDSCGPLLSAEP